MTMKKVDKRIFAAAAILAISAFAAESVEWPADFDSKLSARIEAAKPSGQQCAASAFSGFDSIRSIGRSSSGRITNNSPFSSLLFVIGKNW